MTANRATLIQVDYDDTDRAAQRLRQLDRELRGRAELGRPDTGAPRPLAADPDRLDGVERAARDLGHRLARLATALDAVARGSRESDADLAAELLRIEAR